MVEGDKPLSVTVLGCGMRGLGVLERLIAHAIYNPKFPTTSVHVVDPNPAAPPQYSPEQPDYLLLNIVAGQVSVFPADVSVSGAPPLQGPSLFEWVSERDLRLASDGINVGHTGRAVRQDDFLPRRLLGEYMMWALHGFLENLPEKLQISVHRDSAVRLKPIEEKCQLAIELATGSPLESDFVFVTVGHLPYSSWEEDDGRRSGEIRPYPLPAVVETVRSRGKVAIAGLGLTAMDAVLALTLGRGGEFATSSDGSVRYRRSGNEPDITIFSRSGRPYRARPRLGAGGLGYDPVVFRSDVIQNIRTGRSSGSLDYDGEVLPLLLQEVRIAFARALAELREPLDGGANFLKEATEAAEQGTLRELLDAVDGGLSAQQAAQLYHSDLGDRPFESELADSDSYNRWLRHWIQEDLIQAKLGTDHSPLKRALEIFREFRDVIRVAVDWHGLTPESEDRFFSYHTAALNRLVVGPQLERNENLLALIDAGVVRASVGPAPRCLPSPDLGGWIIESTHLRVPCVERVEHLYEGGIRVQDPVQSGGLIGDAIRGGLMRAYRSVNGSAQGVDVDQQYHPRDVGGRPNPRVWIFGPLCEGATFYTTYVSSPGKFVRSQRDADDAVSAMLEQWASTEGPCDH